jgi:preprotein translocase subunit SecG
MGIISIIEILIIAGIVAAQFRVFGQSRRKIRKVSNLYPAPDKLNIVEVNLNARNKKAPEVKTLARVYADETQAILAGELFTNAGFPDTIHRVIENEKDLLLVEFSASGNSEENLPKKQYHLSLLSLQKKLAEGEIKLLNQFVFEKPEDHLQHELDKINAVFVDLLEARESSPEFQEIVSDTNEYLENNKGAAADFNIIKDISERYSETLDNEVQAGISTPLYIGLLGTFVGVSMGLFSLLLSDSSEASTSESSSFITDEGIRNFLAGVVIAMIGSFCGLLLTLRGNAELKHARSQRDRLKNSYYTFLQKRLLPKLNSDMAASLGNLKAVLDSFNHDFLEKVANFKPIIASLTNNISIQKDFIHRLDEIGFTEMANASVTVFEKVKESEEMFNRFLGYQKALNNTLQNGSEMAGKVKEVLSKMTKLEEAFEMVPGYLAKHDEAIMRQVQFFDRHKQELDKIGNRVEQNFDEDASRLKQFMDIRMNHLERDAQNAYERWQQHFNQLNQDNIYQRILDYMQPFSKLNEQQENLNKQHNALAKTVEVTNEKLLQKLDQDAQLQRTLTEQLQITNRILEEATKRNRMQAIMDKVFGLEQNKHGKIK